MAIFVVTWGGMLAVLIVQAIREDEIGFMLALLRYLLWRQCPPKAKRALARTLHSSVRKGSPLRSDRWRGAHRTRGLD